jgi:leucyl-tRNA synthetase
VSTASYPVVNETKIDTESEVGEYLLSAIVTDISEILKVTKITPKKICIYVAAEWKKELLKKAIHQVELKTLNVGVLIKQAMTDSLLKSQAKEVSSFVGKLPGEIKKLNESDRLRYLVDIDEKKYLQQSQQYLTDLFSSSIEIYYGDDCSRFDPLNKSRFAVPLRPAIYIE